MEIGEPVALAKLPKSLVPGGKVQFGPVWGLHTQTRKRRHEICTAIDGDSINVYDVQNGRIIFSYAIPPTTSFACPPISTRCKEDGHIFRQTFYAFRHHGLFLHSLIVSDSSPSQLPSTASIELEDAASPVVALDILQTDRGTSVVVVQENGTFTIAPTDLSSVVTQKLGLADHGTSAVTILTLREAQRTILKSRQDVSRGIQQDAIILATIIPQASGRERDYNYDVWSLIPQQHSLTFQRLFSHSLSVSDSYTLKKDGNLEPNFGLRSSTLTFKSPHVVYRFDLTGILPRRLPEIRPSFQGHQDVILLSPNLALVALHESLQLLDPLYGVTKANLDLHQTLLKRKKKRTGSEPTTFAIDFVCHFSQLDRVLIYSRGHLIACDIHTVIQGGGTRSSGLLVNNIGRGTARAVTKKALPLTVARRGQKDAAKEAWDEMKPVLAQCKQNSDAATLEKLVMGYMNQQQPCSRYLTGIRLDTVLTTLFTIETSDTGGNLQLKLATPALLQRLGDAGLLSRQTLGQALSLSHEQAKRIIEPGQIANSLLQADHSLAILEGYMRSSKANDVLESIGTVKVLLLELLQHSQQSTQLLLGDGHEVHATKTSVPLHEKRSEQLMALLSLGLAELGLQNTKTISSGLKGLFSGSEMLGLVQILRQQLFKTGYPGSALHVLDLAESGIEDYQINSSLQLDAILRILSACIDAIGPLDLFEAGESDDFLENVIPDLLSEIKLATEAVEEVVTTQGTMRETLRYTELGTDKKSLAVEPKAADKNGHRPGEIVTLYSQGVGKEKGRINGLPMNIHVDEAASPTKIRKGGRQKEQHSRRQMLAIESQQKGAYSFERLVL